MRSNRKTWVTVVALLVACAVTWQAMPASAQSYDPADELPQVTGFERSLTKLGRGLSNILFGWGEIPVTFHERYRQGRPLADLLAVVPVLGTARALIRTGTGVFEVTTFPFSDRDVNFRAVLKPEYIF